MKTIRFFHKAENKEYNLPFTLIDHIGVHPTFGESVLVRAMWGQSRQWVSFPGSSLEQVKAQIESWIDDGSNPLFQQNRTWPLAIGYGITPSRNHETGVAISVNVFADSDFNFIVPENFVVLKYEYFDKVLLSKHSSTFTKIYESTFSYDEATRKVSVGITPLEYFTWNTIKQENNIEGNGSFRGTRRQVFNFKLIPLKAGHYQFKTERDGQLHDVADGFMNISGSDYELEQGIIPQPPEPPQTGVINPDDLLGVTAIDLQKVSGIGPALSGRILTTYPDLKIIKE